ncbi:MAG: MFS transporter [Candidatus Tectomicrobia bacterium]|nr:MFS transporter [Candidatus Tectomicrobia bacterium]
MSRWRHYHTVWSVVVFTWVWAYIVRMGISPLLMSIKQELHLDYWMAGWLASAYFFAYTFAQLPSGYLGDRFGRKRLLLLGTAGIAVTSVLTGVAHTFATLFLARFFCGLFTGTYFGNDRPITSHFTPVEKMGMGQGITTCGMALGMGLGIALTGTLAAALGWRLVYALYALPVLAAGFFIWFFLREPPRYDAESGAGGSARAPGGGGGQAADEAAFSYLKVLTSGVVWRLALAGFCSMYLFWVLSTWAPAMFAEIGVTGLTQSSVYASLIGLAGVPGLLLSGMLSDKLAARGLGRKGTMAAEIGAMVIVMYLLGVALEQRWSVGPLVALIIVAGILMWSIFAPYYALVAELFPKRAIGTAFGFINTINFMASLVAPPVTGRIRDLTGSFAWGAYTACFVGVAGILLALSVTPAFRWRPEQPLRFTKGPERLPGSVAAP